MIYRFHAYGHPNVLAKHKTTLEFTKDGELSLEGDCIVGVNADFELNKLKEFIKKSRTNKITITISTNKKTHEKINATINPDFNSDKELVIRKTYFISERTFAINADKAAVGLNKHLIESLKEENSKISVVIEDKER